MADNPHFQIESGAEAQRFELSEGTNEAVIGRSSDCQWVIGSGAVSRRHAVVRRLGREVTIEDLGSSNGTFVNGERLAGPRALRDQDRVQLGAIEVRFVMPAAEQTLDATIAVTEIPHEFRTMEIPPPTRVVERKPAPEPRKATEQTGTGTATTEARPQPPRPAPPAPPNVPLPPTRAERPVAAPVERSSPYEFQPKPTSRAPDARPSPEDAIAPSIVELTVIAAVSFLVVFVTGALLVRFVF
jgi:pSer/pThr/pTyr-binding forkhead associated (FHA) protein